MSTTNETNGILNPDNAFDYTKITDNLFTYKDSVNNTYFLLAERNNSLRGMEIKIGWLDDKNQKQYDPALPPNTVVEDTNIRGNTICKIFRDEILPRVEKRGVIFVVKPFSSDRYAFIKRVLDKFVNTETMDLQEVDEVFRISKK